MVRKRQGKVLKQIKVDDEGSFLTGLKEKVFVFRVGIIHFCSLI